MSSFSLFLEPLCGLTILCSAIYGGTVTYGLVIAVHPSSQLNPGSSLSVPSGDPATTSTDSGAGTPAWDCIRPYRHSARRVTKLNRMGMHLEQHAYVWLCPRNLFQEPTEQELEYPCVHLSFSGMCKV